MKGQAVGEADILICGGRATCFSLSGLILNPKVTLPCFYLRDTSLASSLEFKAKNSEKQAKVWPEEAWELLSLSRANNYRLGIFKCLKQQQRDSLPIFKKRNVIRVW